MLLKKQALSTTLCIILIISFILSVSFVPVNSADPAEQTELFFKEMLATDDVEYDSSGTFPLLSPIPPTKENASSYPPLIIEEFSLRNGISFIDNETATEWLATWAISLFDDLEEYADLPDEFGDLDELLKQLEIIFPNPLRIIQAYEYTGNSSIQLNGNINYDLYFRTKPASQIHKNDKVKLSVYTYGQSSLFPIEIANTTISLTPGYFQKTIQQSITITNVSKTINPNQLVLFSVELIPGNKTIPSYLEQENQFIQNLTEVVVQAVRTVANLTGITTIEDIFAILDEIDDLIDEGGLGINITKEDIADVLESIISFSFLYDSSDYSSSVTVPFRAADETDENTINYFLHSNNNMDATRPVSETQQITDLAETEGLWTGNTLSRNKIISDATAIIYINHKDLQRWSEQMVVEALLTYGNETLASDTITLERTNLFSTSLKPYRFTFDELGSGVELSYGNKIGLRLGLVNNSNINPLFRTVEIYYDASEFASMLTFSLSETDHIQVSGTRMPNNGKIIVGETVTYTLDITSDLKDTVSINVIDNSFSDEEQEFWDVTISPQSLTIEEEGNATVIVTVTSLGTTIDAYDEDPLEIGLNVVGNTGIDTIELSAEVSEDAVTYDTIIHVPSDREVKHGTNASFTFTIENNNTGLWRDSFIFSADVNKNLSIFVDPLTYDNLNVGNKTNVTVNVSIPENTKIEKAKITLTSISKRSGIEHEVSVNITIIGANIFESMFNYFEGLSESLGLTEIFGEYAPIVLVSIIFIVVFFILILMAFILTMKYVEVICIDRIKEITPESVAIYEILLKNKTNKTRTYLVRSNLTEKTSSWEIQFSSDKLTIPAKQQRTIHATVSASDDVKPGDWSEFQLIVTTEEKSKEEKIPLFCSLSDGTVSLAIKDIFHWPKSFTDGEKVSTSLSLQNKGNVQARNVAVKLFINNKEKNKVEELIIPAGGCADITLPWIAEKGKNELRIMVS